MRGRFPACPLASAQSIAERSSKLNCDKGSASPRFRD
jgi:hypothetical protein